MGESTSVDKKNPISDRRDMKLPEVYEASSESNSSSDENASNSLFSSNYFFEKKKKNKTNQSEVVDAGTDSQNELKKEKKTTLAAEPRNYSQGEIPQASYAFSLGLPSNSSDRVKYFKNTLNV